MESKKVKVKYATGSGPKKGPAPAGGNLVDIDLDNLDQICAAHSRDFLAWAEQLAEAKDAHTRAKYDLDLKEAEVGAEARANPAGFGITLDPKKQREADFKNAVMLDERIKEATRKVHDAARRRDRVQAVVDAFEHRKKMLEKAVDLWLASYFSRVRPKGEVSELARRAKDRELYGRGK